MVGWFILFFAGSFDRLSVHLFVRSLVLSFVRDFVISFWYPHREQNYLFAVTMSKGDCSFPELRDPSSSITTM